MRRTHGVKRLVDFCGWAPYSVMDLFDNRGVSVTDNRVHIVGA